MSDKVVRVGIIGAGTVGSGTIETLINRQEDLARRGGVKIELGAVADLHKSKVVAAGAPESLFVDDYQKVTTNPDIDIVVELVGGTGLAYKVVESALENGKSVVTANKALLSEKGKPLFDLARKQNLALAFEAAVGGGIPCIQAIRDGLICNHYKFLRGILNGTCNYILTEMIDKGMDYDECVKKAQKLGFAEADPTTDVGGFDTGHKLALLSALAFETWVDFDQMHIEGINGIDKRDIRWAEKLGYTIKLLAVARPENGKLFLSVHPALIPEDDALYNIQGSLNAVSLYGDIVEESVLVGRGAGKLPTASAVVSDIVQLARRIAYAPDMPNWNPPAKQAMELGNMNDYHTRYYLRVMVSDEPGVLAKIADALGKRGVSLAQVMQKEHKEGKEKVPLVLTTHDAREGDIQDAIAEISVLPFCKVKPTLLRIEG